MFLNTLHTAHKIFNLLTFTYLLNLLTCSTAKDHETSIEDSSAGFVIFFQFGVVCVLQFGLKKCTPNVLLHALQVQKSGVKQIFSFAPLANLPLLLSNTRRRPWMARNSTDILYSSAGAFHQRPALKVVVKPSLQQQVFRIDLKTYG